MDVPLEIRFHGLDASPAAETLVRERVARLERLFPRLVSCRVGIEKPHRAQRSGASFDVRLDISVAGHDIAVSRAAEHAVLHRRAPGLDEVIAEAFDTAEKRLRQVKAKRGEIKRDEVPTSAG
ncbi:MAG: HPF/RaiA family ribosome-associated protein [Alphaproteobacteria bacterium]